MDNTQDPVERGRLTLLDLQGAMTPLVRVRWEVLPVVGSVLPAGAVPPPRVRVRSDGKEGPWVALPRWPLLAADGGVPLAELLDTAYQQGGAKYRQRLAGDLSRIGPRMWEALLPGDAGSAVCDALDDVRQRWEVLRIELEADDPAVHHLALEALVPPGGQPLGLVEHAVVVRCQPGEATGGAGRGGPLRVLVFVAAPDAETIRSPLVDYEAQEGVLLDALGKDPEQTRAFFVEEGTQQALQDEVRDRRPHAVHVIAHGYDGMLELEDERGGPNTADAYALVQALRGGDREPGDRAVRLVSLCACRSGINPGDPTTSQVRRQEAATARAMPSVARGLLEARLPQVLAMQGSIEEQDAIRLFDRFYRGLARGDHAATALAAARRAEVAWAHSQGEESGVWALPALYEAPGAGHLVDTSLPREELGEVSGLDELGGISYRPRGSFVGRRRERRELLRFLREGSSRAVVLHGMGGVGKSAFAAHLAECLVTRDGRYPLLLRGMIQAASLLEKVRDEISGWGMRARAEEHRKILTDVHEQLQRFGSNEEAAWKILQAGLFAKLPVVLLLDNFEDNLAGRPDREPDDGEPGEQVIRDALLSAALRRLLDLGTTRLRVVITSRFRFTLADGAVLPAGVREHPVGPLSHPESRKLMLHLPGLRSLDPQLQGEAHQIVGGHPRALEYLDALLRDDPNATWGGLAPSLRQALEARVGQAITEQTWTAALQGTVAKAAQDIMLDRLLDRLSGPERAALDAFAVVRQPVDRFGLALVAGGSVGPDLVGRLCDLTLLWSSRDASREAWCVHRLTASALLERQHDPTRVREAHARAARIMVHRCRNYRGGTLNHLLEARYHHLEAGELREGHDWGLALEEWLSLRGHTADALALADQTYKLCERDGLTDLQAEAANRLGQLWAHLGEVEPRAIEWYERSLALYRRIGNRQGEGNAMGNLGNAYAALGGSSKAIEFNEERITIAREIGDRRGEGGSLGNLGNAYAALGDPRKAIEFYEQQLVIVREIGDRRGEGNALGSMGNAYAALGDSRKAIELYEQCLTIQRQFGDRRGEGASLGNLGVAYAVLGDSRKAIEFYEQQLVIVQEIGNRLGEGNAQGNLGLAYAALGDPRKAIEFYEQQLVIVQEIGNRLGEGSVLGNLGNAYAVLGDLRKAIEFYEQLLVIVRQIGDRRGESITLGNLGNAYAVLGDLDRALGLHRLALGRGLADRATGDIPIFVAQLADTHRHRGDRETAVTLFLFAFQQLQEMGYASYVQQVGGKLAGLQEEMGEEEFEEAMARAGEVLHREMEAAGRAWNASSGAPLPGAPTLDELLALLGQMEADADADPGRTEALRFRIAQQLMQAGQPDLALPLLECSVAHERMRGPSGDVAVSLLLYAQALALIGQRAQALTILGEASAIAAKGTNVELAQAIAQVRTAVQNRESANDDT